MPNFPRDEAPKTESSTRIRVLQIPEKIATQSTLQTGKQLCMTPQPPRHPCNTSIRRISSCDMRSNQDVDGDALLNRGMEVCVDDCANDPDSVVDQRMKEMTNFRKSSLDLDAALGRPGNFLLQASAEARRCLRGQTGSPRHVSSLAARTVPQTLL